MERGKRISCVIGANFVQIILTSIPNLLRFWKLVYPQLILICCVGATMNTDYVAVRDKSGSSFMCAAISTSTTTTVSRSRIDCARQCKASQDCIGFNFRSQSTTCQRFSSAPGSLNIQSGCAYYASDNAVEYCVISPAQYVNVLFTPAQNCSFPFTYHGQLYYNCIQNVTNVTQCDQYACLMTNRTWAICSSSTEYQVQNITTVIAIPAPFGNTAVMEVNSWVIFQQNINDSLSFDRPWSDYKNGFGALNESYWMGNERVHLLTSSGKYMLRLEAMDNIVGWMSTEYGSFYLDDESHFYAIHVGEYSGGGDQMQYTADSGKLYHNGMSFSTMDVDNDRVSGSNCAIAFQNGFWYNACGCFILNAPLGTSPFYFGATRMMMKLVA